MKYHSLFLIILTVACALTGMPSCGDDLSSRRGIVEDEDGNFNVKFTLLSRCDSDMAASTRAETLTAEERAGSDVENFINVDDINFLIFGEDRKFIQYLDKISVTSVGNTGYAVYEVYGNLHDSYFAPEISGSVTFHILAYANLKGWGVEESDITRPTPGVTLMEDFLASNSGILLRNAPDTAGLLHMNDGTGGTPPWIPMAGVCKFTVARDMLSVGSNPENPADGAYDLTAATGNSLNMLRALAKIEVVDKINVAGTYNEITYGHYPWNSSEDDADNKNSWLRISSVNLNGVMSLGSVFPDIAQWKPGFETSQVSTPSIPADAEYLKPKSLGADGTIGTGGSDAGSSIAFAPDRQATLLRADKCPVFSAYVFEYRKSLVDIPSLQPYMTVSTRGGNDNYRVTLPLRLAKYEDGDATAADNLDALLRNHIYTYEICGIAQEVKVDWTVCDMDRLSSYITFK